MSVLQQRDPLLDSQARPLAVSATGSFVVRWKKPELGVDLEGRLRWW